MSVPNWNVAGDRLVAIGRTFFGLALLGLGAEHFIFGTFVTGRAPAWSESVRGELFWVYGSGVFVMLVGAAILTRRWGRPAALTLGVLVFTWSLLRQLPIVAADALFAGSWTSAGKALTFVGGLFAIAATLPPVQGATTAVWRRFANSTDPFVRSGQYCLGSFLILAGVQHFKYLAFVATLMPAWFPGNAIWWSQFAGVALFACGVGLLIPRIAALAGLLAGLMIFSWVWIVHLPRLHTSVSDDIAIFEALAFSGIAFVVAGALAARGRAGARVRATTAPILKRAAAGGSG